VEIQSPGNPHGQDAASSSEGKISSRLNKRLSMGSVFIFLRSGSASERASNLDGDWKFLRGEQQVHGFRIRDRDVKGAGLLGFDELNVAGCGWQIHARDIVQQVLTDSLARKLTGNIVQQVLTDSLARKLTGIPESLLHGLFELIPSPVHSTELDPVIADNGEDDTLPDRSFGTDSSLTV
jgi:hypothetical protein